MSPKSTASQGGAAIFLDEQTSASCALEGGLQRVTLENEVARVVVIPEVGAKISSLVRSDSGREFVLPPQDHAIRRPCYGGKFEDYDTSGFDECFPNVAACEYPEGRFRGLKLPDHGEVWSAAWKWELRGSELWAAIEGCRLPYILRKRVSLVGDCVIQRYELQSVTDSPFAYIWAAHPLLRIEHGCRILLPQESTEMRVNSSREARLGQPGDVCSWPIARLSDGTEVDLSEVGAPSQGTADKLFSPRLSHGCCGLYYPKSDESISFHFDTAKVPYVGVWICQGGWPDLERAHYTLALEPSMGRADSLTEAMQNRECRTINPGETKRWELKIQIQSGLPESFAKRPHL